MNSGNEICQLSLKELCKKLSSGSLSSLEVVNSYISHIEKENQKINSVISLKAARARRLAEEADNHLKKFNSPLGPLHGVPFTLKDAFRAKGFKTSYRIPTLNFLKANSSCDIVDRLEKAGAILLGQTNVPLSCFEWQTNSPIYGLTKNPHDSKRTCGGSSGGAAASVAAFMSPFEIGSDVAGSIRYPAHCCGVYGYRPTHGRIKFDDIGPSFHPSSFKNLACAGPIARSIEDLEIILKIVSDITPSSESKEKFKIGYTLEWSEVGVDLESSDLIEEKLSFLKNNGHDVREIKLDIDMARAYWVWGVILGYEYRPMIPMILKYGPGLSLFNRWFNRRRFHSGPLPDAFEAGLLATESDYNNVLDEATELRQKFDQFIAQFDAWITPASPGPAILNQKPGGTLDLNGKLISYSSYLGNFLCPTALFHHPIISIPIGKDKSGLPIGIQLHGKHMKDEELLKVAKAESWVIR